MGVLGVAGRIAERENQRAFAMLGQPWPGRGGRGFARAPVVPMRTVGRKISMTSSKRFSNGAENRRRRDHLVAGDRALVLFEIGPAADHKPTEGRKSRRRDASATQAVGLQRRTSAADAHTRRASSDEQEALFADGFT